MALNTCARNGVGEVGSLCQGVWEAGDRRDVEEPVSVGDVVLLSRGGGGSQEACEAHQFLLSTWPPGSGNRFWVPMGTTRTQSLGSGS